MQLVTFIYDRAHRLGALVRRGGRGAAAPPHRGGAPLPSGMIALPSARDNEPAAGKAAAAPPPPEAVLKRASVRLAAPIPRPGKIICIGLNYRDHAAESNAPLPEFPVVFAKYTNTVIGPGDAIVLPRVTEQVDYEGELG